MEPHETSEAASLLAGVESREVPLAVYADWLEDRGDDLARGVRWLAVNDRRPRWISRRRGYEWPPSTGTPSNLPLGLHHRLWERYPMRRDGEPDAVAFSDAIHRVAAVLTEMFPADVAIDPDVDVPEPPTEVPTTYS